MEQAVESLLREKYHGEKSDAFFADCKRLALGEPLAYLIGYTPFLDTTIHLDSRPLIPRPETEFWVEKAIQEIKEYQSGKQGLLLTEETELIRVMDVCAGSGCVGVATLHNTEATTCHFSEIDKEHIPTIKKNLHENKIPEERYVVNQSSLFSTFKDQSYHFIFANPPYVDPELHLIEDSVKDFEPHLALMGGHKGLELIIQTITEAKYHLEPDGQLWIEHDPQQTNDIGAIAAAHGFKATTHSDQYNVERFSILVLE